VDGDLLRAVAHGCWSFTKWGLRLPSGGSPDQAAAVMARALRLCSRETGTPLAVDAVGTWTVAVAMAFARHVDTSSLVWLEDPLPRHDLQAYGRLAGTGVPLAVGERASVEDDAAELIGRVKPRALTVDVVGCGGLTRAVQILHVAQARHTPVYPHGRSLVPGLHLAAAFPEIIPAVEYRLQWEPRRQHLYDVPIQPDQGRLQLPDSPGLGTTPRSTACPAPR
jgi:L-alanine-DL-glutamate epimerase-like enolase superfamily enzyme